MKRYFTSFLVLLTLGVGQTPQFASARLLRDVAEEGARLFLDDYYAHASQRFWDPTLALQGISPPDAWKGRRLLLIRGMLNFEEGPSYRQALEEAGFETEVFPPSGADLFQPWPVKAGLLIRGLIEQPERVEENAIYVGHSSGGLVVYLLAAMAWGGDLEVIQQSLPPLQEISLNELEEFADRLRQSGASFVTIATPFDGVELTLLGSVLDEILIDPQIPLLVHSLTGGYVVNLYDAIGLQPDELIDANILGDYAGLGKGEADFRSWAIRSFIRASLLFFARFTEPAGPSDGLVPRSSASLSGVEERELPLDHLALIETPGAARALLELVLDLEL